MNHFHAAGGLGFMIGELLEAGLLHGDVRTIAGDGLACYTLEPVLGDDGLAWRDGTRASLNDRILRPAADPFQRTGGLAMLTGNLGQAVIKTSAVAPERHVVGAPARVFQDQEEIKAAFRNGALERDFVCVLRFQGPQANGMPELHSLTPLLSVLQDRGFRVALLTDGRMSGASGKVPAAIHVTPEAAAGGAIARCATATCFGLDAPAGRSTCSAIRRNSPGARRRRPISRPTPAASGASSSLPSAAMSAQQIPVPRSSFSPHFSPFLTPHSVSYDSVSYAQMANDTLFWYNYSLPLQSPKLSCQSLVIKSKEDSFQALSAHTI